MSAWRETQLTGAENQRKRNSLRDCIERKKTYPAAASSLMQHSRLSASWTKSFAMFERRDLKTPNTACGALAGRKARKGRFSTRQPLTRAVGRQQPVRFSEL